MEQLFGKILSAVSGAFEGLVQTFINDFIVENRWRYLVNGLGVTIKVALLSAIFGIILGAIVAVIRSSHDKTGKLKFLNLLCKIYTTVIRGTPIVLQLMIIYFIVFGSVKIDKSLVAIIAFSINSGAYVSEIIRSGIMSVDNGQLEAGRSLGFGFVQTMWYVIIPQAIKNVLPALANEFITLLKETSVVGYIALEDLTRGGDIIRSITFDAFMPLIAVALIYLGMVCLLSAGVARLERRLRASER